METQRLRERKLNLKATELRLGLPRSDESVKGPPPTIKINKRASPEMVEEESRLSKASSGKLAGDKCNQDEAPSKAQIGGWPPVQSYRKNSFQLRKSKAEAAANGMYVKVSMDGAPYLRKVDLKVYKGYPELLKALEYMFNITIGEVYAEREEYHRYEYAPTYEDRDGDWMLVGDVPWEMFTSSCKKLRIIKGWEAQGFGSL